MFEKPMLLLTVILIAFVCLYFFIYGFSTDSWTRYGQYAGLAVCGFMLIDSICRPN